MPNTEPIEALKRLEGSGKSRGSILSALLGLLFLTAFLPLVLTSRYLVNQARADLERTAIRAPVDGIVIKRSMGRGYAGIDNELYTDPKTGMLFADAKAGLEALTQAVKAL